MTITVHNQVEADNMVLISQLYHGAVYSNHDDVVPAPQEPKVKARRQRRKKSKAEMSNAVARKRKLSAQQVDLLEQYFDNEHKLESERKDRLASELGLDPRQVAVWFQNRRARWKNKKLEEEFSKLKAAHENAVVEKCRLESEVMKLKEQLDEARNEIQRLSSDGVISSHSPMSSSISVDANVDPPFLGEFGVQGYDEPDDVFYMPENNYGYIQSMEWFNLYM